MYSDFHFYLTLNTEQSCSALLQATMILTAEQQYVTVPFQFSSYSVAEYLIAIFIFSTSLIMDFMYNMEVLQGVSLAN